MVRPPHLAHSTASSQALKRAVWPAGAAGAASDGAAGAASGPPLA